jgi:hypothetical protein
LALIALYCFIKGVSWPSLDLLMGELELSYF